jgi:hypothetical protein
VKPSGLYFGRQIGSQDAEADSDADANEGEASVFKRICRSDER